MGHSLVGVGDIGLDGNDKNHWRSATIIFPKIDRAWYPYSTTKTHDRDVHFQIGSDFKLFHFDACENQF